MSHEYIYIQVLSIPRPIQSGFSSIYNLPKDSSYREIRFYVIYAQYRKIYPFNKNLCRYLWYLY